MGLDLRLVTGAAVMVACATASVFDVRFGRIPNWLTYGTAAGAVGFQVLAAGWSGLASSVAGWAVAAALFLPFFALGGLGAGDVKLAAAVGAWIGPRDALWCSLYAAMAGGILALLVALGRGYARTMLANLWHLLGYWRAIGLRPMRELTLGAGRGPRLAYAVPITAGALLTLWLR